LGANGDVSDGGVFKECPLCDALEQGYAGLYQIRNLYQEIYDKNIPYALVGIMHSSFIFAADHFSRHFKTFKANLVYMAGILMTYLLRIDNIIFAM